ncbi:MAG: isocitrate lyase/PEP mutase family protein [Betaproteobacteria bacterium]|nr:isocitrate lyase/PEP mutase family protein [Betaproteobacteria bacterium]
MSRWQARRERFRSDLSGNKCVYPGSVFDPISARIAEDLGFEVGMFAGSVASMTVLGAPDLIVLTLTEFAEQAHRICRASNLPLLCDADHGYGNALNVMRTVEELETAGVAGLSIEDTDLPAPFGGGKPRLVSIEEGVGKMRAAVTARRDPGLVIAGRTSAPSMTSIADTIARAKAYGATGVDAIFLVGVKSRSDLDTIAAEVKLPLILGGAGKELMDRDWLAQRGVRICLQGHQPFTAAVRAVHDTLRALREGMPPEKIETTASDELMKRFTRNDDYARWMKDWL